MPSEKSGRTLREERRRLREPPLGDRGDRVFAARDWSVERKRGLRRAGCKRGEHIAVGRFVRRLAAKMDQARRIGVLKRVNQRRLPAGEQRRGEEQPR
jgi:hypothetical protein